MSELITLNLDDRTLYMSNGTRLDMGVQGDEGFQEYTFVCPIQINDSIRLNQCNICIAYKNTKTGVSGIDEIGDLLLTGPNTCNFIWKPEKKLYLFSGIVQFTLWLIKYSDDKVVWSWHSRRAEGIIHPMTLNDVEGLTPTEYERDAIPIPFGLSVTEVD